VSDNILVDERQAWRKYMVENPSAENRYDVLCVRINSIVDAVAQKRIVRSNSVSTKVKAFFESNYYEPLTLPDTAKAVSMSPSRLRAVFKNECGETVMRYLTKVRIRKAKEFMRDTDRTLTEIAFDVGFQDSNYFSTVFKKYENCSPNEWRKQQVRQCISQ
jgi:two-component system response regulator YesN